MHNAILIFVEEGNMLLEHAHVMIVLSFCYHLDVGVIRHQSTSKICTVNKIHISNGTEVCGEISKGEPPAMTGHKLYFSEY